MPSGMTVEYAHTTEGELAAVVDGGGTRSTFEYDYTKRLTAIRRDGALVEAYRYETSAHRVVKVNCAGLPAARMHLLPTGLPQSIEYPDGERDDMNTTP